MKSKTDRAVLALMAVVLAALPFMASGYVIYVVNLLMVFVVLALGLHIVIGETGQFALSHAAFYGVGIYTAGLINNLWHPPFFVSIVAGGLLAALLGYVIGALALRMRGLQVLPAHQVHWHVGVIEPFELQRDAHAVRGRRAKVAVKLHGEPSSSLDSNRLSCARSSGASGATRRSWMRGAASAISAPACAPSGVIHSSLRRRSRGSHSRRSQPRASRRPMAEPDVAASSATWAASVT